MNAAVLFANEDIRFVKNWPDPICKDGEVVLRVAAAGICGSDIPRYFKNAARSYPLVLGHEFSGVVAEVGKNVQGLNIGDHAVGAPLLPCGKCSDCQCGNHALCKHYSFLGSRRDGAFAEFVALPALNVVKIAPSVPLELASLFEVSTVALHALRRIGYHGGKNVAVLGSGAVGLFAIQWAKIFGAGKIVAVGRNPARLDLAVKLGADFVIGNEQEEMTAKSALDLVNGQGFDYIFETAGAASTTRLALMLAGNKARVCLIGTPGRDLVFEPSLWEQLNRKEAFLSGSWMSYSAPFPGEAWTLTGQFLAAGALKLDPQMICRRFPLEDARAAFELYRRPGEVKGRVLLAP